MDLVKHARQAAAIMLCTVITSAAAFAQGDTGFLRGQGKFDAAFSYSHEFFDKFWVGNDKVSDPSVGRVTRTTYSLYGAFGVQDDIDAAFNVPYEIVTSNQDQPREDDFQDLTVSVKWRALSWRDGSATWSLLLAPGAKVPLSNYEDNAVTALGDGQTDYRGRVIGQLQFDNGLYFAVESGFDKRAGRPEDEIPLNAQFGYTFAEKVTISPFLSTVFSQGGTDIGQGPFPGNQEEFLRLGVLAYVRFTENFGLNGMYRQTINGMNTGETTTYSIGAVLKF